MAIQQTTFYGNQFIGMFAQTNDSITLIGNTALPKFEKVVRTLKTEPVRFLTANSDLVGLYAIMNNNGILISAVVDDSELDLLIFLGLHFFLYFLGLYFFFWRNN